MSDPTSIKTLFSAQQSIARALLYQVMAVVFRHPSAWKMEGHEIRGHDPISILKLGSCPLISCQPWQEAARQLDEEAGYRIAGPLSAMLRELARLRPQDAQRDHESLFGHSAHGKCPPYELEYGEEHSFREPQQLADIAAFYNAFGLQSSANVRERVDHASLECEFAQFLLFKQAWAQEGNDTTAAETCQEAMRRFLQEHIGQWIPSFALRVSRHASAPWLRCAAEFALAFVVQDCEAMGITAGRNDLPVHSPTPREASGCTSCSLKNKGIEEG